MPQIKNRKKVKKSVKAKKPKKVKKPEKVVKVEEIENEPVPTMEHLELLISDEYELTRPIPIRVYRYRDGVVVIRSIELNLYAQDYTDHDAMLEFSTVLIEELEELESDVKKGQALGRTLQIELSMLQRLIRRIPE